MYRTVYDRVLIHTDPEKAHHAAIAAIGAAGATEASRRVLRQTYGRRG
ncbi:MAG TPA: quinone-dependent dihydroorotate dehydrogenase, partial [Actinomycetales bacterium]|nr:quinone-dependent dihydroorotate dehydrogenase [Actinomycetales bacterium]